jgi:hypothetical protein
MFGFVDCFSYRHHGHLNKKCFFGQVKDTVQVDRNVSRHLPDELNSDDWNLLVSFYFFFYSPVLASGSFNANGLFSALKYILT